MVQRIVIGVVIASFTLGGILPAEAQRRSVTIEVRVWESTANPDRHYISARHTGGSWQTLGTNRLLLNNEAENGRYQYGGITIDVPHSDRDPVTVEVRVWQSTQGERDIYVNARPVEGSGTDLEKIPLPLDGTSALGNYRYGHIHLNVSVPPPLPSVTRVQFFGDFTEDQRVRYEETIRVELESAARFYRDRYGLVTPDLEFRLTTRDVPEDRGFAYGQGVISLRQNRMEPIVQEQIGGTITFSAPEFGFLGPLAHEYVHALQEEAGSLGGPLWIREGMAWYLDALYDQAKDEPDRFKAREHLLWQARGSTVTLPTMERLYWHWGVGYLAIEQLVERSSEEPLFDFFRNLGDDYDSWQGVFAETFGVTVDAFYEDFAAWRARVAPPQAFFSGVVVDPDGNPVEGIMVTALRTLSIDAETGVRRSSSWIEISRDDGTFDVYAFPSVETVIFLITPECAHVGLLAEDGGLTQSGEEARRFAIELEGVSDITITLPDTREELCTPETANTWFANLALGWRWH